MCAHIRLFGASPNLVLLLTVSWVLLRGRGEGILIGLVGGLMLDAFSGAPFGLATGSLVIVTYLTGLGEINVFRTAKFLPYAAIMVATSFTSRSVPSEWSWVSEKPFGLEVPSAFASARSGFRSTSAIPGPWFGTGHLSSQRTRVY